MTLEGVKWLAVGLMVFDHVAAIFFPDTLALRAPGRLVFPIFASLMALNLSRGYPPERYARRLLAFALLAQPVYAAAFGGFLLYPLNILFSLLSAALLRSGWGPVAVLVSLFSESPASVLLTELLSQRKVGLAALILGGQAWLMGWPLLYALLAGGSVFPAWAMVEKAALGRRSPWWVFYAFYPGHLAFLALLKVEA